MGNGELIPHLFRTEYRKIVAVLCKHFGLVEIETAEDIASETFLTAMQSWGIEGLPNNPVAWLYTVAKNKAGNFLQRHGLFNKKIAPAIAATIGEVSEMAIDLSEQSIADSQLQMMFAICHPSLPAEAQVGLSLRILCGFGIEEIAAAFLSNKETINKRLYRAKETLRQQQVSIELPPVQDLETRLDTVLTTIYLLFNEGYYSSSQNAVIRKELCFEAMRLCTMLIENPYTNKPQANALLSLMCFHASRLDARTNKDGEAVLYEEQDKSLWNNDFISKGIYFLHSAAGGPVLSAYHLEAGIAYWATQKEDTAGKWANVLQLYNQLLLLQYSPVTALNRLYALSKAEGKGAAIREAEQLQLKDNRFYYSLLGELYTGIDDTMAKQYFNEAYILAKTITDKQAIQKRIDKLQ